MTYLYKVSRFYRNKEGAVSSFDIITLSTGAKNNVKPDALARLVANGNVENVRFDDKNNLVYNDKVIAASEIARSAQNDGLPPANKLKVVRVNKRYDGQLASLTVQTSNGAIMKADIGGMIRELKRNPYMFSNVTYTKGKGWVLHGKVLFKDFLS